MLALLIVLMMVMAFALGYLLRVEVERGRAVIMELERQGFVIRFRGGYEIPIVSRLNDGNRDVEGGA